MKKYFLSLFILVGIFVLTGCAKNDSQVSPAKDDSSIILFYGSTCPHCKIVEDYLAQNKVSEKVQFSQREVYGDKANALLLSEKAKKCGIAEDAIGVPFLWSDGKCYVGQEEVINHFKNKLNENGQK